MIPLHLKGDGLHRFARVRAEAGAERAEALEAIDESMALTSDRPRAARGNGRWVGPLPAVGLRREMPRALKGGGGGETMSTGHRTHTS